MERHHLPRYDAHVTQWVAVAMVMVGAVLVLIVLAGAVLFGIRHHRHRQQALRRERRAERHQKIAEEWYAAMEQKRTE